MSKMTFTHAHMEQLRKLGMGGYPCATYAAREIEQLNEYAYALECVLLNAFPGIDEVRVVLANMRERFAPDVELPELEGREVRDG